MRQYPIGRQIGQRRRGHPRLDAVDLVRHPQRLGDEAIQSRTRDVRCARRLPRSTDLSRDLLLPRLGGIETARDEKQVFQGRLTRPRTQDPIGLTGLRRPPDQRLEYLAPAVSRRGAVEGRVEDFDAVTGTHVQDLTRS